MGLHRFQVLPNDDLAHDSTSFSRAICISSNNTLKVVY